MRVISWNLNFLNRDPIKALEYMLSRSPNVACLQEVPLEALQYLQKTKYKVFSAIDIASFKYDKTGYMVVITDQPVISSEVINYSPKKYSPTFISKLFGYLLGAHDAYEAQKLTINSAAGLTTFFNIHLTYPVSPKHRRKEFLKIIESYQPEQATAICGDFNTIGITPLNPFFYFIFGYSALEIWRDERKDFDKMIKKIGLQNFFFGYNTWPWMPFKLQLDHILANSKLNLVNKEMVKENYGSDHLMLIADFEAR